MENKDIAHIISKYYDIEGNENASKYSPNSDAKGLLRKVINNKLNENLIQWQRFAKEIESTFPDIVAVKQGHHPVDAGYTIVLLITEKRFEEFAFTQELFCHFSCLTNFFCIYGKDRVYLSDQDRKLAFDPIITISPRNIFEDYFSKLRVMIEKTFPVYSFLPFLFLKKRVIGLRIFTTFLKENQYSSVYQALFTHENLTDYTNRGDILYK